MRKLIVIWPVGHSAPDLSAIWKLLRMTSILSIGLITVLVVSNYGAHGATIVDLQKSTSAA
jgi:hypothetical protein